MPKGFYFHMNTCIGCGACQVACKDLNKLQPGEFFRRVDVVRLKDGRLHGYSGACNHCEEPACVAVCPTGAMYKTEEGPVLHDDGLCIGCGSCISACPYGAVSFSKTRGFAQKCDSCIALREAGMEPACVSACPTHSLGYGEIEPRADLVFLPTPEETHPVLQVEEVGR